jgi:hypothetical protein
MDLGGVTATMVPPRSPEFNEGYFEIIEGPVGPVTPVIPTNQNASPPETLAVKPDPNDASRMIADTTVGDFDDILMFTARSLSRPFVGRCAATGGAIESDVAEIAWFVRGRTLYRRVLLVAPGATLVMPVGSSLFAANDISLRSEGGTLKANALGDLCRRKCRYGHDPTGFPFDARGWGQLGLPTLRECSHSNWAADTVLPAANNRDVPQIDLWNNPHPWTGVDPATGAIAAPAPPIPPPFLGPRVAEDVILTNVIGFDVKVWDPGAPVYLDTGGTPEIQDDVVVGPGDPDYETAMTNSWTLLSYGAYVDLGYAATIPYVPASGAPMRLFYGPGDLRSRLDATAGNTARVYDTWSLHYEHDDENQDGDGSSDEGTDGFDNDGINGVDDPGEMETSPPYPAPLRGIQVKIRVFEPDSRQIREVTVVQDFLPK